MENGGQVEARYVILTQAILGNKELTPSDKLVLARISGFERFYESNEATAEFLGIGTRTIRECKYRLLRLGYIIEVANTGHGKVYMPDLLRVAKSATQSGKICQSDGQNLPPENKERIKKEQINRDGDKKEEYGRSDLNELVSLWKTQVGVDISKEPNQRRQLYNLVRKNKADGTKALIERVARMRKENDQYAPLILKPSDLTGKFSKLEKLIAWEERYRQKHPAPTITLAAMRNKPPKEDSISDEERAEVSRRFKEAREKLGFLKSADIDINE